MFVSSAEEILKILGEDTSAEAHAIRSDAKELATFFASWPTTKPDADARFGAIQRVMDLTRRALDLVARRPAPPSGGGKR